VAMDAKDRRYLKIVALSRSHRNGMNDAERTAEHIGAVNTIDSDESELRVTIGECRDLQFF
jgi:hypothetical protein